MFPRLGFSGKRKRSVSTEVLFVVVMHGLERRPDVLGLGVDCHRPHEYHTIGSTEFVWLHLDGANTPAFYQQVTAQQNGFVFDLPHAAELRDRIFELVYACRNDQLPNESRLSYALYGILITLLSGGGPCGQGQQGLREHHLPRLQRRQVRL